MVVLEVGNGENIIGRKLSFSFLGMKLEFEVLIVTGVQGHSFGRNGALARCQQKKCGRRKDRTMERKRLPSDCALNNTRASFVSNPRNLPRLATGYGFCSPPQRALSCFASFRTHITTRTLNARELSRLLYTVLARRQQQSEEKGQATGQIRAGVSPHL
jgi:hypothetical protein